MHVRERDKLVKEISERDAREIKETVRQRDRKTDTERDYRAS